MFWCGVQLFKTEWNKTGDAVRKSIPWCQAGVMKSPLHRGGLSSGQKCFIPRQSLGLWSQKWTQTRWNAAGFRGVLWGHDDARAAQSPFNSRASNTRTTTVSFTNTHYDHTTSFVISQTQVVFCLKKKPPHKLKCRTDCLIQQRFDIYKKKKKKTIHLVLFNAVEHPQNEWAPAVTYIRAAVNRCQLCLSILSNLNKNI